MDGIDKRIKGAEILTRLVWKNTCAMKIEETNTCVNLLFLLSGEYQVLFPGVGGGRCLSSCEAAGLLQRTLGV